MKKIIVTFVFIAAIAVLFFVVRQGRFLVFTDSSRIFFKDIFKISKLSSEISRLTTENQKLKIKIDDLEKNSNPEEFLYSHMEARVYSRYPSNDRSLIIVSAGSDNGIAVNMPVFLPTGALVGRVSQVFRTQSVIETVFSSQWKTSVGIGKNTKAVLQGGSNPSVALISKESQITAGDYVYNLAPEYPLRSFVGTISSVHSGINDVWQTAEIVVPYEIQDIKSVFILIDFP